MNRYVLDKNEKKWKYFNKKSKNGEYFFLQYWEDFCDNTTASKNLNLKLSANTRPENGSNPGVRKYRRKFEKFFEEEKRKRRFPTKDEYIHPSTKKKHKRKNEIERFVPCYKWNSIKFYFEYQKDKGINFDENAQIYLIRFFNIPEIKEMTSKLIKKHGDVFEGIRQVIRKSLFFQFVMFYQPLYLSNKLTSPRFSNLPSFAYFLQDNWKDKYYIDYLRGFKEFQNIIKLIKKINHNLMRKEYNSFLKDFYLLKKLWNEVIKQNFTIEKENQIIFYKPKKEQKVKLKGFSHYMTNIIFLFMQAKNYSFILNLLKKADENLSLLIFWRIYDTFEFYREKTMLKGKVNPSLFWELEIPLDRFDNLITQWICKDDTFSINKGNNIEVVDLKKVEDNFNNIKKELVIKTVNDYFRKIKDLIFALEKLNIKRDETILIIAKKFKNEIKKDQFINVGLLYFKNYPTFNSVIQPIKDKVMEEIRQDTSEDGTLSFSLLRASSETNKLPKNI